MNHLIEKLIAKAQAKPKPKPKPLDRVPEFENHLGQPLNQITNKNMQSNKLPPKHLLLTTKHLRAALEAEEKKVKSLEVRLAAVTAAQSAAKVKPTAQSKPAPQAVAKPGLKPAPAVKVSRRTALELIQLPKELRDGMDRTAAYLRTEGAAIREEIEAAYEAADVASRAGLRSAFPNTLKPRIIR